MIMEMVVERCSMLVSLPSAGATTPENQRWGGNERGKQNEDI